MLDAPKWVQSRPSEKIALMRSVDNALRILTLVGETKSVRVVEVASHLGVSRSTAHRLLDALNTRGYVVKDAAHVYRIGPAFSHAGLAMENMPSWQPKAHLQMRQLASDTGETCHLAVLEGNSVRFIDGIISERLLRVGSRVGMLLPAHTSAAGNGSPASRKARHVAIARPPPAESPANTRRSGLTPCRSSQRAAATA